MVTTKAYALLENGMVHTDDLDIDAANEMRERHARIFPDIQWAVVDMDTIGDLPRLKGLMERQREQAKRL